MASPASPVGTNVNTFRISPPRHIFASETGQDRHRLAGQAERLRSRRTETMALSLMVAVSATGPEWDFSHAVTASTAFHMLRSCRIGMKPGFHYALTK